MSSCRYCTRVFGNAGARTNHERTCIKQTLPDRAQMAAGPPANLPRSGAAVRVKERQTLVDRGRMMAKIRRLVRLTDRVNNGWLPGLYNGVSFKMKQGALGRVTSTHVIVHTHETHVELKPQGPLDKRVDEIAAAVVRALRVSVMPWRRGRITRVGAGAIGPFIEVEHETGVVETLLASDRDGLWQEVVHPPSEPRRANGPNATGPLIVELLQDDAATEAAMEDVAEAAVEGEPTTMEQGATPDAAVVEQGVTPEAATVDKAEPAPEAAVMQPGPAPEAATVERVAPASQAGSTTGDVDDTPDDPLVRKLAWLDDLLHRVEDMRSVARSTFLDAHLLARVQEAGNERASDVLRRVEQEADQAAAAAVEECRARLVTAAEEVRETLAQLEAASELATKAIVYSAEQGLKVPHAPRSAKRPRSA